MDEADDVAEVTHGWQRLQLRCAITWQRLTDPTRLVGCSQYVPAAVLPTRTRPSLPFFATALLLLPTTFRGGVPCANVMRCAAPLAATTMLSARAVACAR
jgi:hypothetical protein